MGNEKSKVKTTYEQESNRLSLEKRLFFMLPKKLIHRIYYYHNHKAMLNVKSPQLYDEKIRWLMMYVYDKEYGKYADKYLVREYISNLGLDNILIPLLGVYDTPQQIDFDKLPDCFILKSTHASGPRHYEIVNDKEHIDKKGLCDKFQVSLNFDFSFNQGEFHYGGCQPRIICEQLLKKSDNTGSRMDDYKVVCSYGVPKAILVCSDRDKGRDYYDTEWNYLEYTKQQYRNPNGCKKPKCLDLLLSYAAKISKPFPLARVDFYILENQIYFGEITLTPSSGNHSSLTEFGQRELGKQITLPERNR